VDGKAPLFSVVIPLYNKEATVSRAIQSVLAQSVESFELIVINDGSSDNSVDRVLAIKDERIALIEQENQGVSVARNRGIEIAKYPYLVFLDADDEWLPDFLSVVSGLIESFPDAGAYATAYYIKNPGQDLVPANLKYIPRSASGGLIDSYYRCLAYGNNPVWSSAVCIPKSTFTNIGFFPAGVRLYEDLYMWSNIAINYQIAFNNKPCSIYYRDAVDRACNQIVPTRDDLQFSELLLTAISEGKILGGDIVYARGFINRYALLNAFKALVNGNAHESRYILGHVQPASFGKLIRKWMILLLSFFPRAVVKGVWQFGQTLKALVGA
jgi:glycosyltransferase involved in cell wall biosynthesis